MCFCCDTEQMIYVSTDISTEMLDKVDVKLMLSKKQFHHLNLITYNFLKLVYIYCNIAFIVL